MSLSTVGKIYWIAADFDLPDDDITVLMALSDGEVWTGFLDDGKWRYVSADPVDQGEGTTVTHWAHLPAFPEKDHASQPDKDLVTVSYWSDVPPTLENLHRQYAGYLCVGGHWESGKYAVEYWQRGNFDPDLYPLVKRAPFQVWADARKCPNDCAMGELESDDGIHRKSCDLCVPPLTENEKPKWEKGIGMHDFQQCAKMVGVSAALLGGGEG